VSCVWGLDVDDEVEADLVDAPAADDDGVAFASAVEAVAAALLEREVELDGVELPAFL
jgi:hypothetical protein